MYLINNFKIIVLSLQRNLYTVLMFYDYIVILFKNH